ncbi:hypothetical protein PSN45_000626 [Yamadazyma tenuis]|uniref:SRP9 domain-containing protein n=1 Tax=Candida tenuis (strain ATCC 10573 / BCRC 21748 / CBS 615 / JCM 9827 / NBRC 10315 / NRRL Y-1498 / VKM Y-70) TaxID=590646 RepID=G3B9M9_CANTC|nr:uncharacterized protein CANTEDRAFT_99046 [Yamadazyma tenuis ATCC 10573]EGV61930.1 hypothetical protein CANTEDRAFT_99046 [Yamadazyma tenuis ATCC 10573]WEJ93165.1 hypothetical protein PSN45_000626 [Yamadazyma tenuis]
MSTLDTFISSTAKLLAAYPTTARVSITYANEHKKLERRTKNSKKPSEKSASNYVSFKVFEPSSGKVIKYKTYKVKELSKLITFLGPRGVTSNDAQKVPGLSSIMSNKKFDESEKLDTLVPAVPPSAETKDKKKKKKKSGKK